MARRHRARSLELSVWQNKELQLCLLNFLTAIQPARVCCWYSRCRVWLLRFASLAPPSLPRTLAPPHATARTSLLMRQAPGRLPELAVEAEHL